VADVSGVVVLLAIGIVLDLIKKARDRQRQRTGEGVASRPRPPVVVRPTGSRPPVPLPEARPMGLPAGWRRALEEAGPLGRHPDHALESDEEVEERESLEVEPVVRSLEVPHTRAPRPDVDLDDESVLAVARRRREVAARDRPHTIADHRAFDERVRKAKPVAAAESRVPSRAALREAFKWREILGRPVGWRDE
jgi:hypothetical protein